MIKKTILLLLLFTGLAFANPPGSFQPLLLGSGVVPPPATYVGGSSIQATSTLSIAAASVGDLGVIFAIENTTGPTISAGWTQFLNYTSVGDGLISIGWYRVIQGGDTNPTVTIPSVGAAQINIYRGASLVTLKTTNTGEGGSTLTLTGFSKAGNSVGIITQVQDVDNSSPNFCTVPTGFTSDQNFQGALTTIQASRIVPLSYTNNATVQWTGCNSAAGHNQAGYLAELTN